MKSLDPDLQGEKLRLTCLPMNSQHEMTALGKTKSQDQYGSSEYVHDERYGGDMQAQIKPAPLIRNPDYSTNSPQNEVAHSTGFSPFGYCDPFMSGLYAAYGPQAFPQMMGIAAPARVPLPLELAEDGPIYVNAKQYNGILRRRQTRAKLEAQNKLVKNRKPYLHESRHLHAVNRVRGIGGRFLSTKKVHHSEPNTPTTSTSSRDSVDREGSTSAFSSVRQVHKGISFQQPDHVAFNVSSHMAVTMQDRSGFSCNGTQQRAPVVR